MSRAVAAASHTEYLTLAGWRGLLLVLALIVAPQLLHTAPWIGACVIGLGIWRYLVARNGWAMPKKLIRLLLAIAGFLGVWATYQSLNGIVAGSALLTLMLGLKLTETWQRRDCLLMIYLGYVLILAQFLYEQHLFTLLYLIPVIWLHTALFLGINHPGKALSSRTALRMSGRYLLAALPLMLIMFVLFPRIPGSLWGAGDTGGAAVSGLDGTMSPGSISRLIQSDAVAFRADFTGPIPPIGERYWRGPVLHHFDGKSWEPGKSIPPLHNLPDGRDLVSYTVTLEPHNQQWLYALDIATTIPSGSRMQADYMVFTSNPVTQRSRYSLSSTLQADIDTALSPIMRRRDLQLPAGFNPRARALAKQWQQTLPDNSAVVQAAQTMFHQQDFYYTLEPPKLDHHSVDDFLFNTKRGYCEHYASAFVFLMRAADIPARVVTGYLGMEKNPLDNYFIVRQSDAHAWAEVWLPEKGWVRVDPTAAIHPSRILVEATQSWTDLNRTDISWFNLTILTLRAEYIWDSVIAQWHGLVLAYGPEAQKSFLQNLGLDNPSWRNLIFLLIGLLMAVGAFLIITASWRNRPPPQPPLIRAYQRFCKQLARHGVTRRPSEGPRDFSHRAQRAFPQHATAIARISGLYQRLRYTEEHNPKLENAFLKQVRDFRAEKK